MIEVELSSHEKALCCAVSGGGDEPGYTSASAMLDMFGAEIPFIFAQTNEVAALVAHKLPRLQDSNNMEYVRWHAIHEQNFKTLSAYLSELDHISSVLEAKCIPLVALKNGGIARGIYPCPGCCPMGDLDVLVKRRDFRDAHRIMLAEGYNFEFRSPLEDAELDAAEQGGGAEYWKILPSGDKLWFELQWRPVAGRWLRPDQEPTAEELMERSISIPGTDVRLLSPEDNLLQVSLHTAKHTYIRAPGFRLHLDVERIVRFQEIDWDIFLERVVRLQVKTPVFFSLLIPKLFFNTPIPEYALDLLRPGKWKESLVMKWLNKAGFFNPDERKFGRVSYVIFNMLLYDDVNGLLRSILPDANWMMRRYNIRHKIFLPLYHIKRLTDLIFRRMKT